MRRDRRLEGLGLKPPAVNNGIHRQGANHAIQVQFSGGKAVQSKQPPNTDKPKVVRRDSCLGEVIEKQILCPGRTRYQGNGNSVIDSPTS